MSIEDGRPYELRPMVSVIVVNFNGDAYLDRCLTSISAQTYPALEVILVDNASRDGSVKHVKRDYPWVRVIENASNLGFAKANNIGIRAAKGEYIATLNNDTEVTPQWIEELAAAMGSDNRLGMCASKMVYMDDREVIDSTGICISRSGACWDRGIFERDHGQYDSPDEVFGPCAGAALYRRAMFDQVGLFDEDFVTYMEDSDLAFRGRLAGWKCLYLPKAVVYHVHGGTAGYASSFSIYYGNRNIIWVALKNFPLPLLLTSLPFIVGRNLAVIPYYMLKGYGVTILRAKTDALKGILKMLKKRRHSGKSDFNKFIKTWANIKKPPEAFVKPAEYGLQ